MGRIGGLWVEAAFTGIGGVSQDEFDGMGAGAGWEWSSLVEVGGTSHDGLLDSVFI